jgi:hypothetical protein
LSGKNRHQPGSFNFTVTERFKKIAAEVASIGFGFTPAGIVFDTYSIVSGRDFFTGVKLTRDEMIFTAVGMTVGQGALFRNVVKEYRMAKALTEEVEQVIKHSDEIAQSIESLEKFSPITKEGPLSKIMTGDVTVASTFRSGTYHKIVTNEEITLFRVYGSNQQKTGSYWSRVKPYGPIQAMYDQAISPSFNKGKGWIEMKLPKGSVMYEGVAAHLDLMTKDSRIKTGYLIGGGNQIYLENDMIKKLVKVEGGGGVF